MANANDIFVKGVEKLKGIPKQSAKAANESTDFYSELYALRQHWRIKKVGEHLLGDISYKSGMVSKSKFFTGISRNTYPKSYMLSLTGCVWDFSNNALWDTQ